MASTLVGIVYGRVSGIVLRSIFPDDDNHFQKIALHPGEALVTIPRSILNRQTHIEALMAANAKMGGPTLNPPNRAVIVDPNGIVVAALMADPVLYQPPAGHAVLSHATALVGGTFRNGTYVPPSQDTSAKPSVTS
jgi:hypothetical protein